MNSRFYQEIRPLTVETMGYEEEKPAQVSPIRAGGFHLSIAPDFNRGKLDSCIPPDYHRNEGYEGRKPACAGFSHRQAVFTLSIPPNF
ncbi:MAG: hypothetical protein RMM06_07275 [Armatimonadota bacterium]|nr:hypothetical protein [bacterium]MCS7310499.1 hypothetical protein [Armatimonadota bacterium]MDW8290510.1 hypothetical protein [Armatimonadota bacterium]